MVPWHPREGQLPAAALQDVRVLQQAADGALWLVGAQGAVRVDAQAGSARLLPSLIAAGEVSYGAAARLDDGRIAVGAGNGLHVFLPGDMRPLRAAPPVALSQMSLFNQPLQAGQPALAGLGVSGPLRHATQLTLAPGQNVVGFEFAALWHGRSGRAHYAWQLQGFDSDWKEGQGDANLATYTNLDPGRYVLTYRAALDGGPWSDVPGRLEITVLPPFWRTGWWYALMGVLALALLLGAYHLRVRVLKATRRSLERQVAARTQQVLQQQARLVEEKAEADRQREAAEAARGHIGALSELGRQVMATLDAEAVCRTLCSRLALLIDVRQIRVLRTAGEGQPIELALAWEDGAPCALAAPALDEPGSLAARCIRGPAALSLSRDAGGPPLGPDAPEWAHAALLVPLSANGATLGALAVFHALPQVYGSVQLDLLRTLAGHVAGALGNAEAYRRLRLTQAALVEREKMAALGALVAGVAHELNTPLGNGLLLASTLQDQTQQFADRVAQGGLRLSELKGFVDRARDAADLIVTSLHSAAALVRSFKQVAVDQTADVRRPFELRALCDELAATLANQLRPQQHTLTVEVADGLVMDSYPGSLGQVLTNLILNAVHHGFEGRRHGAMRLKADLAPAGREVRIVFTDDGAGITAEHLPRIFEPFFTTRLGRGGSGLGLHISYNIVTSLLGGAITVQSAPGQGARFELLLPHTAPRRESPVPSGS
jgi:signal transduction histidine kinase